jgi:hypothetical protein
MTWIKASLLWSASIALSAIPTLAQGTIRLSVSDSQTIVNAPYSAAEETELTQTLADGTHMVTRKQTRLYRDSYGRTRAELFLILDETPPQEPRTIEIKDPVAGSAYTLFVRQRVARLTAPPVQFPTNPINFQKPPLPAESMRPKGTSEELGTQSMEGVLAEGLRMTTVYPVGSMGNDKPIQVVSERWVSKELGLTLFEKYSDPRFGETITRVTSLDRAEPDPTLFRIPADYIVQGANAK